jgi:recombinational DNA repair ATPase RecF
MSISATNTKHFKAHLNTSNKTVDKKLSHQSKEGEREYDVDTKLSLLMKTLTEFFRNVLYIEQMRSIVDQNSVISLRILDWFITNYSKKYRTIISTPDKSVDVYQNYKLQLKSFSKKQFDPFCRKNKIMFYYTDNDYIETSCGQLCFFRWCFENEILDYVKNNLSAIEQDMKNSLKNKKTKKENSAKRQPLSVSAARSVSKQTYSYTVKFD